MKAVIPAAGLGTRMLPASKAIPKEMLPVVDKPVIQYAIEEIAEAGISDVVIVTAEGKASMGDHFDRSPALEARLTEDGKDEYLERVQRLRGLANIHLVRQHEPRGLGHAVLCARPFVGDDRFAVLLPDDIMVGEEPPTAQLARITRERSKSTFSVIEVDRAEIGRYGAVDGSPLRDEPGVYEVDRIVEKPAPEEAPSTLATMGRYVFEPTIFDILERTGPGHGGEIQLTDAMDTLASKGEILAVRFDGDRLDVGTPQGFVEANVEMARRREDIDTSRLGT